MKRAVRVLLVEDSPDIQLIVRLSLENSGGFGIAAVSSGAEALERLAGDPPDLVLLDVMMPGMDGMETLRRMRERPGSATVPVIFMTAKVLEHEVTQYKSLGVLGVISKPFDPLLLPETILEFWSARPGGPLKPGGAGMGSGTPDTHAQPPALVTTG